MNMNVEHVHLTDTSMEHTRLHTYVCTKCSRYDMLIYSHEPDNKAGLLSFFHLSPSLPPLLHQSSGCSIRLICLRILRSPEQIISDEYLGLVQNLLASQDQAFVAFSLPQHVLLGSEMHFQYPGRQVVLQRGVRERLPHPQHSGDHPERNAMVVTPATTVPALQGPAEHPDPALLPP